MNTQSNYDLLIGKINLFIRRYYFNNLLRGLIFLGAGLFSAYVVITLGEYFFNFNTVVRTTLFYAFILLNLGLLFWLVVPSLLAWLQVGKTLTHDEAAEIIGKHFADVKDKLLNTLQLKKLADADANHRALIEASIDQKIDNLRPVSFPSAINLKENNKYLKWMIAPAGVICILLLAAPSILTESTKRLINHGKYYAPVAPFQFEVLNKNLNAVQGEDVKLELKMTGSKLPADVYVETNGNTFKLDKDNLARFHYLFSNLQQNTQFRLSANGFSSENYEIKVNLKPSLLNFDVELNYPAYLHKQSEKVVNAGDLTIPAGTTVKWEMHTQHADQVLFALDDKSTRLTTGADGLFEHSERILHNGVFALKPESNTVAHGDSASYRINVIADEMPAITVIEKADSISSKALYFNGRIQDDHGFTSLTFHYKAGAPGNNTEEKSITKAVKADLGGTQSDFFYYWDMKDLAVKPGDELSYYFEVADNDAVSGPKKARTPERTMKMPTEKELADQLAASSASVKQKMASAIKIAGQLEKDAAKLNQMLLNKNSLSFDEKKQVEDLMQKKKDLNDLIKDIQAENRKNQTNRQENQQQSDEITQKQKQMEDLLKNVMDPKTQEMLDKLAQLLETERKEPTRDAVNKMQNENRNLKRELSRAQELMKKLEFDQKLDQTIQKLNKLADKQDQLAQKTQDQKDQKANADQKAQQQKDQQAKDQAQKDQQAKDQQGKDQQAKNQAAKDQQAKDQAQKDQQANAGQQKQGDQQQKDQDLQKEQEKLNQEFKDIEKQMDDLKKQEEQLEEKTDFKNSPQEKQSVEQDMEDSKQQIQKNQKQQASKSQKSASQKMKKMAQKMQQDKDESEQEQNSVDAQQLRELLKSLVNSSFDQEKVMQTLKNTGPTDPNYVTLAQKQKDIKDNLKTAEDTLYSISRRIPQIQSTVNTEIAAINEHIDKALESLGDRRTGEANRDQQYAMTSMNNLALMLSDAKDQLENSMKNAKSGKGKGKPKNAPSMQQLSKMQQQLNQNMQQMRDQMQQQQQQGGKENQSQSQRQGQSERLARMARAQQDIREQLEKINQQENKDGKNGLGDLQKIAKQMEQTENDLVNRKITDESIKRQAQIQVKLLEAEKAEQQREEDNKRDSRAGKDIPPGYIKALESYQQAKAKQTEQIKTVPAALNLYYKQKIKSYFDQLNAK